MKGQTELPSFTIKLLSIAIACVFILGGVLSLSLFKVTINSTSFKRLAVDFAENFLSAPCLAVSKNVLSEEKLNSEQTYAIQHRLDDLDGVSCLETAFAIGAVVKAGNQKWNYGYLIRGEEFVFPAVVESESGERVPATLTLLVEASTECKFPYCNNCLDEDTCRNHIGCRWTGEICVAQIAHH